MADSLNRRSFIKQTATASLGLGLLGKWPPLRGPNAPSQTVVVGVMGLNGRGRVLAETFAKTEGVEVAYVCDVDNRLLDPTIAAVAEPQDTEHGSRPALQARRPQGVLDFRRILDDDAVDALVIAAPDHWHAPATILALEAGKHVYVEKPCGHNPHEGELLVAAQQKYGKLVQMGNQQRSSPESIQIIEDIHSGIIGRPYYAKCWYANQRGPIGTGQVTEVPAWLDFEMWQGPAPRSPYKDNLIHYNWHWMWNWGTGEICNNGTHEIDICRWALGVDYPVRVTSVGGRYHFDDDWEFYDTQVASFDFEGEKTIVWEGKSCNPRPVEGRGRGSAIHGTEGTVIIDREGYVVYDLDNREIWRRTRPSSTSALDTRGGDQLTDFHVINFAAAIRDGVPLHAPIDEGHISTLLCHLGNIAQEQGRTLTCDPANGHILGDDEAARMWSRTYENGWEPKV